MPLSLASAYETCHNIQSVCNLTGEEIGGGHLPETTTKNIYHVYEFESETCESVKSSHSSQSADLSSQSADLSSQSSEFQKPESPINRAQLHFGFHNRQVHFTHKMDGTQAMREIEFPTSIYEFEAKYDGIIRQCFEEDEEIMILVFEDSLRDLIVIASFSKYYLDKGQRAGELLFFSRKGQIVRGGFPKETTLHFIDFLRCTRNTLATDNHRSLRRLKSLVKRDIQSCLIHHKMSRKRMVKQFKSMIFRREELGYEVPSIDLEEQDKEDRFAWLSGGEFRDIFGVSLSTVKKVMKDKQ